MGRDRQVTGQRMVGAMLAALSLDGEHWLSWVSAKSEAGHTHFSTARYTLSNIMLNVSLGKLPLN